MWSCNTIILDFTLHLKQNLCFLRPKLIRERKKGFGNSFGTFIAHIFWLIIYFFITTTTILKFLFTLCLLNFELCNGKGENVI